MLMDERREEIFSSLYLIIWLAWPLSRQELSILSARFDPQTGSEHFLSLSASVSAAHLVKSREKVFGNSGKSASEN